MLHCVACGKDVEILGIPGGVRDADKIIEIAREAAARAGRLILLNPPPLKSCPCPSCGGPLIERTPKTGSA